jgi:type I restriction enzyme M protein
VKSTGETATDPAGLVRRLWQYCNVLRDDGLSYPDYVEQLTYLLFLKMSDEQMDGPVPSRYSWRSFAGLNSQGMHRHYSRVLDVLGKRDGMLGLVFRHAKNKIRDPAKLRLLIVGLIGQTDWTGLSTDVKGDAYEGLLEKNARDTKSGAGQYFTPRPLIEAIVECVDPAPGEVICDPACGTGGFLLAFHEYVRRKNRRTAPSQQRHLTTKAVRGVELVEEVARLATMNLLLHGISGEADSEFPISCYDSLKEVPEKRFDIVLTNPPFGVKGSITYGNNRKTQRGADELTVVRPDFWVQTSNKQLNFLQHVYCLLKPGGRAAIVIPDNALFEGGAGATIRRRLLETCDVHTLLRLPPGLFYAQGVKANVLFFDRSGGRKTTRRSRGLRVYDLRSEHRFSLKTNPLRRDDLKEFVELYAESGAGSAGSPLGADGRPERWRRFDTSEILESEDCRFDLVWERELRSPGVPSVARLDEMSRLIIDDLQRALTHMAQVANVSADGDL